MLLERSPTPFATSRAICPLEARSGSDWTGSTTDEARNCPQYLISTPKSMPLVKTYSLPPPWPTCWV